MKNNLLSEQLVYTGESSTPTHLHLLTYNSEKMQETYGDNFESIKDNITPDAINWLQIHGLKNTETIRDVCEYFKIDFLVLQDILNAEHPTKIEEHEQYTVLILKLFKYEGAEELEQQQLCLIQGSNYVLAFIENHDTDRFLGEGDNLPMLKQASTLLLTTRRIPQLYYGTEIMMNGVKSKSDGYVRKDFPGGWAEDKESALTASDRTQLQNDCYNFYKTLLNWRKGNEVIAKGSMTQFMVQNGVYAYARQYEGKTVFVMLNGTDAETTLPLKFYKEVLKDKTQGKDILTGRIIQLDGELTLSPRESLVIEL